MLSSKTRLSIYNIITENKIIKTPKYIPFKKDGFLVEIGVGHTVNCGSNTADLLDIGWGGIYIEPVLEYCNEARIRHKDNLERLKIVNYGASDVEEELSLYLGDSFIPNTLGNSWDGVTSYEWIGRKYQTKITNDILIENKCPEYFEILSIDVEGFEDKVLLGINFEMFHPKIIILEKNIITTLDFVNILPSEYKIESEDGLNVCFIKQ